MSIHIAVKIFLWNSVRKSTAPPRKNNHKLAKLGIIIVLQAFKTTIVKGDSPSERFGKIADILGLRAASQLFMSSSVCFTILFQ
ncbi:hypothetical protein AO239_09500 [Pseudomonas sp. ICMP 19500]|nr:hypothetical protein CFT9_21538 [Pseudomonas sp. CFT9]KTC29135.1 hypothetical protein AO239_09500 [Pseudomonas sp. ICMP 19500]OEC53709.1 hypothetical protein A7K61_25960 [Pseudomonas sp. AP42]